MKNKPKLINKLIALLFALSLLLITAFSLGLFATELELLEDNFPQYAVRAVNGDAQHSETFDNQRARTTCEVVAAGKYDVCGASFIIEKSYGNGIDLSSYDSLLLTFSTENPLEVSKVKFSLRNNNEAYSLRDQPDSHKYNSVVLKDSSGSVSQKIPLSYFQVESWWVREFGVEFEDAQLDFTNIVAFDLINNDMSIDGTYIIEVSSIKFFGEAINITQLLSLVAALWLSIIVLLVARNRILLHERATRDHLTGIPNRNGLQEWIDSLSASANRPVPLTMFYIDIDDFKKVNDTYGHSAGDIILTSFCKAVKSTMKKASAKHCIFSRLSGDEFVIYAANYSETQATQLAKLLYKELEQPVVLDNAELTISISMGIASNDVVSSDTADLSDKADMAMYYAKVRGKNRYKIYNAEVEKEAENRREIARAIREAIENDLLDLQYMPIFDIESRQVKNVEVLLRTRSEELTHLGPREFVPIAEEFGLIQLLDAWVMKTTFSVIDKNRDIVEQLGLCFCINVSTIDLQDKGFSQTVISQMQKHNIKADWFALEITETAFESHQKASISSLNELSDMGISIVLDNFGTGYTALNQLISYPINGLKIDKSFTDLLIETNNMNFTKKGETLIRSIINIANEYDLKITAEGVENLDQFYFLEGAGCDLIQGYLYSEPLSLTDLTRGLRNQDLLADPSAIDSDN
ncbi:GGDEF and EAL domain-containing protein [Glaciecola sp. MH2013]|uniref:putative bifunctional diguanylate cyclase/phosphodiesterase n=1 Tax=Glaciecola sp. MH2013 TaxID=2785524 RepID=UPI00189D4472|nr:GGDEF and EAL domain-containing protein [Glaciecola sp. MH2013]MBF7075044.1 GGDEF and EAL domain-containing protein [Glaciecola sp. MH2013]